MKQNSFQDQDILKQPLSADNEDNKQEQQKEQDLQESDKATDQSTKTSLTQNAKSPKGNMNQTLYNTQSYDDMASYVNVAGSPPKRAETKDNELFHEDEIKISQQKNQEQQENKIKEQNEENNDNEDPEENEEEHEDEIQEDRTQIPYKEKELGAQAFKKKDYQSALVHYSKALLGFKYVIEQNLIEDQEKMIEMIEKIQLPCNLNLCLCYMKQNQYSMAEQYASTALDLDENNIKALYRRAICRMNTGFMQESRSDLKKAYKLDPKNKDIQEGFELLRNLDQKQKDKMKKVSKKMIENMEYSKDMQGQEHNNSIIQNSFVQKYVQKIQNLKNDCLDKAGNLISNVKYNSKMAILAPFNFMTELCCRRKVPSQMYKKKQ